MPDSFLANTIVGGLCSAVGFFAFAYGKRIQYWTPMLCGLGLMLIPLFVDGLALLIVSLLLGATAFIFRHT